MIIISNENIMLSEFEESMAYDVWQNSLDEANRKFVPDEVFETLEDAENVVSTLMSCYGTEDGPFVYAIIRKEDSANIGYVQLVKIEEGFEVGYHIAEKYTNKGYATEALKLFIEYIKEKFDISEIYGVALADNFASRRVLEKVGFEKYFEGEALYQGENRIVVKTKFLLKK